MTVELSSNLGKLLQSTAEELGSNHVYVVGVAIFRHASTVSPSSTWELLVVRRAEDEVASPNMWELPGGHVEQGETIYEAVCRETFEETGLVVQDVIGQIEELRWTSKLGDKENIQFNFVVAINSHLRLPSTLANILLVNGLKRTRLTLYQRL